MITHRRTEILTYNPNFDFGAVYTNTLWDALDTWGHYASCLVVLYLLGKLMYTLVSVVVTHRKGTSWATALKLNTFLLTEFGNNLVQTLNETERRTAVAPPHGIELEELN